MLRQLYYLLPVSLRLLVRRLIYLPQDLLTAPVRRAELMPPRGLMFTGSGDFREQGERFLGYFTEYGGLRPDHHVLDVGSGIGRMAVPLTRYLSPEGRYEGFDIVPAGIRWCRNNISRRYPNFTFRLADLDNDLYNDGDIRAESFRFPYGDASFDFVFLTSVFTHLLPAEVDNYLSQISRVLRPGGRCLATFFVLNEATRHTMQAGHTGIRFPHHKGHYSLMSQQVQSANVAYEEAYLRQLLAKNGLRPVHWLYGRWAGRPTAESVDFQDMVVVEKI